MINESSRYDEMGVGSISNKDNADPKQLKWEMTRDFDHKRKGGKRFGKNKTKSGRVFKKASKTTNKKSTSKKMKKLHK